MPLNDIKSVSLPTAKEGGKEIVLNDAPIHFLIWTRYDAKTEILIIIDASSLYKAINTFFFHL